MTSTMFSILLALLLALLVEPIVPKIQAYLFKIKCCTYLGFGSNGLQVFRTVLKSVAIYQKLM